MVTSPPVMSTAGNLPTLGNIMASRHHPATPACASIPRDTFPDGKGGLVPESWEDVRIEESSPIAAPSTETTASCHVVKRTKPTSGTTGIERNYFSASSSIEMKPMWANCTRRNTWNSVPPRTTALSQSSDNGRAGTQPSSECLSLVGAGTWEGELPYRKNTAVVSFASYNSSDLNWRRQLMESDGDLKSPSLSDCEDSASNLRQQSVEYGGELSATSDGDWRDSFKEQFFVYETPYIDSHCHIDFLYKRLCFQGSFQKFRRVYGDMFPPNYGGCVAVFCHPYTWPALVKCTLFSTFYCNE